MPIRAKCNACSTTFQAKERLAGKTVKCPKCSAELTIPEAEEEVLEAETVDDEDEFTAASDADDEFAAVESQSLRGSRRPCPECGEDIAAKAAKCRFCGAVFDRRAKSRGGRIDRETIEKFRKYAHGLGGAWIFFGVVAFGIGIAALSGALPRGGAGAEAGVVLLPLGLLWLGVGICVCLKHRWAIYVGLTMSYLSVVGNILVLNVCALMLLLAIIIQAHQTLSQARKLLDAGVALDTMPRDV